MKIVIIRHGDPDYIRDSLTKKGWEEAEALAEYLKDKEVSDFYVSPLGRAQDTASLTLKKMERTAETLEWLEEFPPRIWRPDKKLRKSVVWDWLPEDWMQEEIFYDFDHWFEYPLFEKAGVREKYERVCNGFDALLERYGYVHEGRMFHTEKGCHDTIVLFCHFGVQMVILSHIMKVSPMILWHHFVASPTSVTLINSEERKKGNVIFRTQTFGDLSHLRLQKMEPSFAARYCEVFEDKSQH